MVAKNAHQSVEKPDLALLFRSRFLKSLWVTKTKNTLETLLMIRTGSGSKALVSIALHHFVKFKRNHVTYQRLSTVSKLGQLSIDRIKFRQMNFIFMNSLLNPINGRQCWQPFAFITTVTAGSETLQFSCLSAKSANRNKNVNHVHVFFRI